MATFIALHKTQKTNGDGSVTIKRRQYTSAEIAELWVSDPSAFITVPESHAAQVIRPQAQYQEVEDVVEVTTGNDSGEDGSDNGSAEHNSASGDGSVVGGKGERLPNNGVAAKGNRRAQHKSRPRKSDTTASGNK